MVNYDIEGGEKTEKGRSIRSHSLAWTLVIVFLLSSLISTIGAVKPISPGKPAETWDLTIWIGTKSSQGNPTEDVVLDQPDFLLAEDVACSGGLWNTPVGKGIKGYVSAQAGVYRWFENGEWNGAETCGTYYLAHKQGVDSAGDPTYLDEFYHGSEDYTIVGVSIGHNIDRLGQNYWWFRLQWIEGPPFDENSKWYELWTWTSKNINEEGVHPETNPDVWIVEFNNADAMICSSWIDENPNDGMPDTYDWTGPVSFTVKIIRSPSVS